MAIRCIKLITFRPHVPASLSKIGGYINHNNGWGAALNEQTEEWGGNVRFKVWVTRGCYFALYDRLKRKARYSNAAITILSFYVLVVAIIQISYTEQLPDSFESHIPPLSIILSVFIIIVSLLEQSNEYRLEAEHSLRSAHRLEELYGRFESLPSSVADESESALRREYSEALVAAKTHRKSIDYVKFQLDNLEAFEIGWFKKTILRLRLARGTIAEYWLYAAMIILPPAGLIYLYYASLR